LEIIIGGAQLCGQGRPGIQEHFGVQDRQGDHLIPRLYAMTDIVGLRGDLLLRGSDRQIICTFPADRNVTRT
jgi:hypothetical protein